jgi:hypothetical protein
MAFPPERYEEFIGAKKHLALGANISSTDEKWLPSLSTEQKLFGGPFSVTGSVSETPTGETSKSLTAGFKRQW